jgi:hypothetical protein
MMNPDGYEYLRASYIQKNYTSIDVIQNIVKNRDNIDSDCIDVSVGVSLRHNYLFDFGLDNTGSSEDLCSQAYRGYAPFSERETRAFNAFLQNIKA